MTETPKLEDYLLMHKKTFSADLREVTISGGGRPPPHRRPRMGSVSPPEDGFRITTPLHVVVVIQDKHLQTKKS